MEMARYNQHQAAQNKTETPVRNTSHRSVRRASTYSPCTSFNVTPTRASSRCARSPSGCACTLSYAPRPRNSHVYTSASSISAMSSQQMPSRSAAWSAMTTQVRDTPYAAICRPVSPSARNRSTRLALILRTIRITPFSARPATRQQKPRKPTPKPEYSMALTDSIDKRAALNLNISGPQRSEYSPSVGTVTSPSQSRVRTYHREPAHPSRRSLERSAAHI